MRSLCSAGASGVAGAEGADPPGLRPDLMVQQALQPARDRPFLFIPVFCFEFVESQSAVHAKRRRGPSWHCSCGARTAAVLCSRSKANELGRTSSSSKMSTVSRGKDTQSGLHHRGQDKRAILRSTSLALSPSGATGAILLTYPDRY